MERRSDGTFLPVHGMYDTRLYHIWEGMKGRCYRESCNGYEQYGGRGIKVCPEWSNFVGFYKDMAPSYSDGMTLDRKCNNSDYSLSNCRWATTVEQARNKSTNVVVEINDKSRCLIEWKELFGLTNSIVYKRYHRGELGYHLIRPSGSKIVEGSTCGLIV